jgi:hypothetical protein
MLNHEISIGRTYIFNNKMERAERVNERQGHIYVNGKPLSSVLPVLLTDELFDDMGFKYYNGWYCPFDESLDLLSFVKDDDCYTCYVGSFELIDLRISYLHELQNIVYHFKGKLI